LQSNWIEYYLALTYPNLNSYQCIKNHHPEIGTLARSSRTQTIIPEGWQLDMMLAELFRSTTLKHINVVYKNSAKI